MRPVLLAALLMLPLCSPELFADTRESGPYFSLLGSFVIADDDRGVDDDLGGQMGIGFAFPADWNLELYSQFASLDGVADQDLLAFGVDFQKVFRSADLFRPYLFIGGGMLRSEIDGLDKETGAMLDAGAGFRAQVFGDGPFSLRGEYRYRVDRALDSTLGDSIFSLGVEIAFGPSEQAVVVRDSDGDGVIDADDRCPGTPPGSIVNPLGCVVDADNDGVTDSMDECPNTPAGAPVDLVGCPLDSDRDGVMNLFDECPDTPVGEPVDERGCTLDTDGDGVPDHLDLCPDTRPNAIVDINGCEIREEIRLPGVNFATDAAVLLPGGEGVLNDAVATLQMNPTLIVEVAGHTDNSGPAEYNEALSSRRAQTVGQYLTDAGISSSRVFIKGYGEAVPIADNATADGRAANRRVVLRIIRE